MEALLTEQQRSGIMIRFAFLLSFIFFSSFSLSLSLSQNKILIAQDESLFDDSDLADIESGTDDESLEDEFESGGDPVVDNFNEEDFEVFDEEAEEEEDVEEEKEEKTDEELEEELEEEALDKEDYEIISDRPDYEVISDEELEEEFEGEEEEENKVEEETLSEDSLDEEDKKENVLENLEEEESDDLDLEEEIDDPEDDIPEEEDTEDVEDVEDVEVEVEVEEDMDSAMEEEDSSEEALNLITNIRYLAAEDQIIIDCSEPTSYQVRKNPETNQFIIEILQAKLADNLHWPYVLRDFNTNFGLIKADQKDSSTVRIVIQLKEGAEFPESTLTENSDQILIAYGQVLNNTIVQKDSGARPTSDPSSILPAKTLEDLYFSELKFSGFPISFHVIDAPIKQVLRFISEESGLNMVIGESVTGSITLKLENVPWDQALHTIFKVKSLGYTRDGNVITILPLTEIEERTIKLKEIADRQKNLSAFETKAIPVSYGKIDEIANKVKDFSTPASNVNKGGRIIVHPESNTFIVIDTPAVIKKMEALVSYLDKPPKQVMVEAKIVEVAETFIKNFGLTWGLVGNVPVTINASGILDLIGNISGEYAASSEGVVGLTLRGLPVIGDINANLNLAENEGYAEVISTPKVVVISGKQASITRDSPILIGKSKTETDTPVGPSRQSSLESESIAISLDVTPTVTTTGSVFLNVNVNRTEPGPNAGSEGETLKIQRTAQTEVLVKNGQTIVIGGIYEEDTGGGNAGIPFLKDVPVLNWLFNTTTMRKSRTELLVFITPTLLDSHE